MAKQDHQRVVIAGCGRTGSCVAAMLDQAGHRVSIIDRDRTSFRRLPNGYRGKMVVGVAFDRDTLIEAGIEDATAVIAVTSGDNSNVLTARTALEHFGVPLAIARIYDPARAEIYERHGVTTIAPTRWTVDEIQTLLFADVEHAESTLGSTGGDIVMITAELKEEHSGPWEINKFEKPGKWMPVAVSRNGQTTLRVPTQLVQRGERIHLLVQHAHIDEAQAFLADAVYAIPEEETE